LEDEQVAVYPLMAAPPSFVGAPKFTVIELIAALADTAVGAVGTTTTTVVAQKVPARPPIVSVVQDCVLLLEAELCRTVTFCPGLIVPAVITNAAPLTL
jgi:hypothetical protein